MTKSNNNRILSAPGESECGHESLKKCFHENALNKASSNPEHRRRTRRRYKKKKATNNPGKTVRIPIFELTNQNPPGNCSSDLKPGCSSQALSSSAGSTSIRFWLNTFCIEVNNDFNASALCRLVETLKKI